MFQSKAQAANTVLEVFLNVNSLIGDKICQGAGSYTNKIPI